MNGVLVYQLTSASGAKATWTLDLKSKPPAVYREAPRGGAKADVTITVSDEDFVAMVCVSVRARARPRRGSQRARRPSKRPTRSSSS